MSLRSQNPALDNRLRAINKCITDATRHGFATEFNQDMQAVSNAVANEVARMLNDLGVKADLPNFGAPVSKDSVPVVTQVMKSGYSAPVPQFTRSAELLKLDQSELDKLLTKIENLGTMGQLEKKVKQELKNKGVNPTKEEIKKELIRRYNQRFNLYTKFQELYDIATSDEDHPLHDWVYMVRDMMMLGHSLKEFEDQINEYYEQMRFEQEGLI